MSRADRALVLTGFMGAGKSSAARRLANRRGGMAIDVDKRLEAELGESIAELFAREGESAFREREEEITLRLLSVSRGADVIALGGGALGSERVRTALSDHVVAYLEGDDGLLWRRVHQSDRPLARDRATFRRLHEERRPVYEAAADAFLPALGELEPETLAPWLKQLQALDEGARFVWSRAGGRQIPVLLANGIARAADLPVRGRRRFAVTDEAVAAALPFAPLGAQESFRIPPGEESKTLATCERVWRWLVAQEATRSDVVVAFGGGVVGDLAGYCAACYQRGIGVVQVPTTLVAQVDSAYGGKTGVDLPEAKNYVGAYHQPSAVLTDPSTLATLPRAERAAGFAEVVKTALIAGGTLWERVRAGAVDDAETIFECLRTKLAVVAADERDGGRRQVLNLGHTVGHAIETVTGYARYRHGEAVALGLLAALELSEQPELRDEVAGLLRAVGLPTELDPAVEVSGVVGATKRDKKRLGDGPVPFVLVRAPGDVVHGESVAGAALADAVAGLRAP